ncbi:MAG: hypothetical protein EXQ99_08530 [Alphaproteobacteria bacterium]|nr:hypothetical protein [Alphaproteobacteria bacterium]
MTRTEIAKQVMAVSGISLMGLGLLIGPLAFSRAKMDAPKAYAEGSGGGSADGGPGPDGRGGGSEGANID